MTLAGAHDLVIFDLDGVVYLGAEAVPQAPAAIRAVVAAGTPVAFATNNASRRAHEVAAVLSSLDVPARAEDVITSAQASAELLAADLPQGAAVLPVGSPALGEELSAVGLRPVASVADRPVAVVQGFGPQVGWPMLAEACVAIRGGARWVATNGDATMPSPRGPLPGNGSLVAALRTALGGREPDLVVGKPEPGLFAAALRHHPGGSAARTLVVGDRLDTDIEGAHRAGMASLLVLTGVTTPADLLAAPAHQRPDYVVADLRALSTVEDSSRIPAWSEAGVAAGAWRVELDRDQLVLSHAADSTGGDASSDVDDVGGAIAALRALAGAAWANPRWSAIRAADEDARRFTEQLGLADGCIARPASAM